MINEQHNFSDQEGAEVSALLATLKRVNAPGDFNFRVKARIAHGQPAKPARSSWATLALRLSLPAVVMATAGGYLGYRTLSSDNFSVATINDVPPAAAVTNPPTQPVVETTVARQQDTPMSTPTSPSVTPDSVLVAAATPEKTVKPVQKPSGTAKPEAEKPAGGSYDSAVKGAEVKTQPDIDDNDTKPVKKVLVSAATFLSSSGVSATAAGQGGTISSVSGAAAAAGLKAGDVIESVSVVSGTIRVTRDGKTLSFVIR